jgi:hypothetical protein
MLYFLDGCYECYLEEKERDNRGLLDGCSRQRSRVVRSEPLVVTDAVVGRPVVPRSSFLFALSRPLPPPSSSLVCCLAYSLIHLLDPFI